MLPFGMEARYYIDAEGRSPFAEWFEDLDAVAGAKIVTAIARIEQGNLSNVKSVGQGVLEYRIDFGPGYRIYFGRDGDQLVLLLLGGTKKRQQSDIVRAGKLWSNYRRMKAARRQ